MVMLDFISIGEVMIQLNSLTPGPLRYARYFEVHVAGAEANVMIGLSKLGYKTGLITRVGGDEFGELIIRTLRGEDVDVSQVKVMEDAPTGIYFIQRHYPIPGKSTVFYYRHGSAASHLNEEDVNEEYVKRARAVFLTGITPALSKSAYNACKKLYNLAREYKLDIIFDTNIRMKLWKTPENARSGLKLFLEGLKILFTNKEDLKILFPENTMEEAVKELLGTGIDYIVVKMGEEGSKAFTADGVEIYEKAVTMPFVEDVIGAGDAFDAVFIASIYRGLGVEKALRYANIAGALAVTVRGDIEAQPTWRVLELMDKYLREKMEFLR
ncbi:MAG: sugar kinase [Thermoprotei archaeon]